MRVVFVHGACVRDGAWWWRRTAAVLAERGVTSETPLLPSCGEGDRPAGADGPGFDDDVAAVRAVLTGSDEPTVVVAHSYGGIVVAQAAAGVASVRHGVLVASYLPEPGESLSSFAGGPAPFLTVDAGAGTFGVVPEAFAATFMADCPGDVAGGLDRLAAQTVSVTGAAVTAAAWHDVATTYVVCAEDRGTPADRQREFAQRADRVAELPTGHHPFLARPEAVADIVATV